MERVRRLAATGTFFSLAQENEKAALSDGLSFLAFK